MAVVRDLRLAKYILESLLKRMEEDPDFEKTIDYSSYAVGCSLRALDRAIKRYESESKRTKKYYRKS
jgi:hypothetical protein